MNYAIFNDLTSLDQRIWHVLKDAAYILSAYVYLWPQNTVVIHPFHMFYPAKTTELSRPYYVQRGRPAGGHTAL